MTQLALHETSRGQRRVLRDLATFGASLALAVACDGSKQELPSEGSGNSAGVDNTGGSAAGGTGVGFGGVSGGSGAGGSSGGSDVAGGVGNSGAVGGAATGGAAGTDGMSGRGASGGTPGSGGAAGSGGDAAGSGGIGGGLAGGGGIGGIGGAGGSGAQPSGAVAELGDACDSPAALACAGNHQRVTLICDGGSWRVNETCPENYACDTAPGFDQGTCKQRLPECADRQPGEGAACEGPTTLMVCGPDSVTLEPRECAGACNQAACDDRPNHCPREEFLNCGTDCRAPDRGCIASITTTPICEGPIGAVWLDFESKQNWTVRIPDYAASCVASCDSEVRGMTIYINPDSVGDVQHWKATVRPPWRIIPGSLFCASPGSPVEQCLAVNREESSHLSFAVATDDPTAPEENVTIESAPEGVALSCP